MKSVVNGTHEIDLGWLNEALKSRGRLQSSVTDLKVNTIGEGVGLMGELARLELTYEADENLPSTMIAKCAAQNENIQVAQVLDFYNREVNFYNKINKACGLKVPDSYYGAVDQETYQCVILMEDLGDVSPNDQIIGASESEAISAIDEISGMHAKFWGKVGLGEYSWLYQLMGQASYETLRDLVYAPAVEPCIENFSSFFTDETRNLVREVGKRFPEFWSTRISPFETFVHGDYRQDNFLYMEEGSAATVMDWQISGSGKGIFDFSYFMCQSLPSARRKELEKPLLERYIAGLKAGGVTDYDFDTAFEDYRLMILGCLVYPITVCGSLDLSNERGKALGETMLERNLTAIDQLGCAELLN
jgi:hypothetical protein